MTWKIRYNNIFTWVTNLSKSTQYLRFYNKDQCPAYLENVFSERRKFKEVDEDFMKAVSIFEKKLSKKKLDVYKRPQDVWLTYESMFNVVSNIFNNIIPLTNVNVLIMLIINLYCSFILIRKNTHISWNIGKKYVKNLRNFLNNWCGHHWPVVIVYENWHQVNDLYYNIELSINSTKSLITWILF